MSIADFIQLWEYFGLFALNPLFLPFYAGCVVVVGVLCVGRIIGGKKV